MSQSRARPSFPNPADRLVQLVLAAMVILVAACGAPQDRATETEPDRLQQLFDGAIQVIDLTHALSSEGPHWPSASGNPFVYEVRSAHDSGATSMGAYSTPEHHGTHIDAPIHSADGQPSVDQLEAGDLFGPIALIDVAEQCAADADYQLSRDDILAWETAHGALPAGAVVLMYTGWSQKWSDFDAYKNQDAEGRMHFPGFSEEAARFLIDERDIRGIGVDTLSADAAVAGFGTHRTINGSGKYQLENVANLHLVPQSGAYLIVAPIKIEGGSGGQVRLFAVNPE
jgi:kynurenine formamidase